MAFTASLAAEHKSVWTEVLSCQASDAKDASPYQLPTGPALPGDDEGSQDTDILVLDALVHRDVPGRLFGCCHCPCTHTTLSMQRPLKDTWRGQQGSAECIKQQVDNVNDGTRRLSSVHYQTVAQTYQKL